MLNWTSHPAYDRTAPPFTLADWLRRSKDQPQLEAAKALVEYHRAREEKIANAAKDPLRHGYELPHWRETRRLLAEKDELYCLGGNGSAKTEFGAKVAVETLVKKPGQRVLCVTRTERLSKANVQAAVWKYLPRECRAQNDLSARNRKVKIGWSLANGFTGETLVVTLKDWLDRNSNAQGSQMWFNTVSAYLRDSMSFEGPEYDLVWCDEPVPISLVETLKYRVGKRGGKMLFTFTAIEGYDAVCKSALDGASITQTLPVVYDWGLRSGVVMSRERGKGKGEIELPDITSEVLVEGCPPAHMPFTLQPLDLNKGVVCFWTHWNPFLPDLDKLFRKARGKSRSEVLCRIFGWTTKMSGSYFPGFRPAVHVIPPERVPREGTDYMAVDPATAKSYAILWLRVDRLGRWFVYDESPRMEGEGEWVTAEGQEGEGVRVYGSKGVEWYQGYIRSREAEHAEERGEGKGERDEPTRYGDPRFFATQSATAEGGTSLLELHLATEQPMIFIMAQVKRNARFDVQLINDRLDYDTEKPVTIENEPKLFISSRCGNLIRAMAGITLDVKDDDPHWDFIDALRYLTVMQPCYNDPEAADFVGGRGN